MLDHVQADRQVEAIRGEGHLEHGCLEHLSDSAGARQLNARAGQLHARHRPQTLQLDHVATATAAGVEDPHLTIGEGQLARSRPG